MVGAVAFFATYEIYKNKMLMLRAKKPDEMDTIYILTAGSLAGAAYVVISHPFETVAGIHYYFMSYQAPIHVSIDIC